MNRKLIYIFGLSGYLLVLGASGLAAVLPAGEAPAQATLPAVETTPAPPAATNAGQIPVTGAPEPLWTEILLFYGLIAITALFLLYVLLNTVNKSMSAAVRQKDPASDDGPAP